MNHSPEKGTNCLVVGAGALGLLLAHELARSSDIFGKKLQTFVFNRTPLSQNLLIQFADESARPFACNLLTGSPQSCLKAIEPKFIFLCVPPEASDAVFVTFFKEQQAAWASRTDAHVHIIFCNNGMLSEQTLELIRSADHRFSFIRALFFVGAIREKQDTQCLVRWTGGHRVLWDDLKHLAPARVSELPCLKQHATAEQHTLGLTQWHREEDIAGAERAKFFTNFLLAAGIGPRSVKNKAFPSTLAPELVAELARECAILWGQPESTGEKLKMTLLSTVAATGENINSLSLAASQGNPSTMLWFIETLESAVKKSQEIERLNNLRLFLQSVRTVWGVKA